MSAHRLARFRADPSKIQVRVRRVLSTWTVSFIPIRGGVSSFGVGRTPIRALAQAMRQAKRASMPGLDPHMQWAYTHPQR